jgi:predicted LPLAT superfamily acyltransferase
LHTILTDADYDDALDELEQLADDADARRGDRARALVAMIDQYEKRVARFIGRYLEAEEAWATYPRRTDASEVPPRPATLAYRVQQK